MPNTQSHLFGGGIFLFHRVRSQGRTEDLNRELRGFNFFFRGLELRFRGLTQKNRGLAQKIYGSCPDEKS